MLLPPHIQGSSATAQTQLRGKARAEIWGFLAQVFCTNSEKKIKILHQLLDNHDFIIIIMIFLRKSLDKRQTEKQTFTFT